MALSLFLKHLSVVPETTANNITDSGPKPSSSFLGPVPFQLAPSKAYLKKRIALSMVPHWFLIIYVWQYGCVESPRTHFSGGWWPPLGVPVLCLGGGRAVSKSRFLFQWHQWPVTKAFYKATSQGWIRQGWHSATKQLFHTNELCPKSYSPDFVFQCPEKNILGCFNLGVVFCFSSTCSNLKSLGREGNWVGKETWAIIKLCRENGDWGGKDIPTVHQSSLTPTHF